MCTSRKRKVLWHRETRAVEMAKHREIGACQAGERARKSAQSRLRNYTDKCSVSHLPQMLWFKSLCFEYCFKQAPARYSNWCWDCLKRLSQRPRDHTMKLSSGSKLGRDLGWKISPVQCRKHSSVKRCGTAAAALTNTTELPLLSQALLL